MTNMTDAQLHTILVSLRALLLALGGILADQGLEGSGIYRIVMLAASTILIVGPLVWGVWSAIASVRKANLVTAVAVQKAAEHQAPRDDVLAAAEQKAIIAAAKATVKGSSEKEVTAALNRSQLGNQP